MERRAQHLPPYPSLCRSEFPVNQREPTRHADVANGQTEQRKPFLSSADLESDADG
jgi:hypothetical protein